MKLRKEIEILKEDAMKLTKKLEILLEVATYAQAGAFEIAREILKREYSEKVDHVPTSKRVVSQRKELKA